MSKQNYKLHAGTTYSAPTKTPPYVPRTLPSTPPQPSSSPPITATYPLVGPQVEAFLLDTSIEPWGTSRKTLRKMPKSSTLSLAMRPKGGKEGLNTPTLSPRSPHSPNTGYGNDSETATPTAPYHTMPTSPASPKQRKDSKSIFSNFHASRSSSRINPPENTIRQVQEKHAPSGFYTNGRNGGSTPDLNRQIGTPNSEDTRSEIAYSEDRANSISGKSTETYDTIDDNSKYNGNRSKRQGVLSRSRSIRGDDESETRTKQKSNPPKHLAEPAAASWRGNGDAMPIKTAPLEKGQSWRQNISFGKLRTHSADRHDGSRDGEDDTGSRRDKAEQSSLASGSFTESRGAALMSSINSAGRKMGEKMGTARKGMFGKLGRSSSNHEREPQFGIPKEQYQFRIINRPLVEQTRMTRISSRLEHSKDKTEFWMPALPWRCIDYLNMKGCEEEGLYRVPGAAHTVRYYEQKFDTDRDIDLISDDNLNDPNVIGSLFKNWLRQLPDEIFPKAIQARIQQECQGAKTTPQMLKDELSKLPPFNYYLLFAITCHISLLHSCSEYNKMNYNNLCICFQPAIKIDAFCFQFLILDWRNCWQGCWTEKEYLAEEIRLLEAQNPHLAANRNGASNQPPAKPMNKGSSGYQGEPIKPSSIRSESGERAASPARKQIARGTSSERSLASGRATPPNPSYTSENSRQGRGFAADGSNASERGLSSSESHDSAQLRSTPKRAPPALSTERSIEEEDNSATPTQAQHTRGMSDNSAYRLDLTNPPSSPFSIKF